MRDIEPLVLPVMNHPMMGPTVRPQPGCRDTVVIWTRGREDRAIEVDLGGASGTGVVRGRCDLHRTTSVRVVCSRSHFAGDVHLCLAAVDRGPRDGIPILYFHGFQGSRLERVPGIDALLTKLKVRLISPDRPGIGLSTPSHARSVVGWVGDVRQLTDQLLGPDAAFSLEPAEFAALTHGAAIAFAALGDGKAERSKVTCMQVSSV